MREKKSVDGKTRTMNLQNYLICLKKNKKQKQSIIIEFDYLNELAWLRYEKEAYRSAATWWVNVYIYRSGWVAKYQAHATWQSLPLFMDRFPPSPPTPFLSFFLCSPAIYEDYNWNEPGTRLHLYNSPYCSKSDGVEGKESITDGYYTYYMLCKNSGLKEFVCSSIYSFLSFYSSIYFFLFFQLDLRTTCVTVRYRLRGSFRVRCNLPRVSANSFFSFF